MADLSAMDASVTDASATEASAGPDVEDYEREPSLMAEPLLLCLVIK